MGYSSVGARRASRTSRMLLAVSTILSSGLVVPAFAQTAPTSGTVPVRQSIDGNGVDLFLGKMNYDGPSLSAGQDEVMGIDYHRITRSDAAGDSIWASLYEINGIAYVNFGGTADAFTISGTTYSPREGTGATLTLSGTIYTYTARDGTVIHFDKAKEGAYPYQMARGLVTDVTRPSGATLTYTYDVLNYCSNYKQLAAGYACLQRSNAWRASSATSKGGYKLQFQYNPIDPVDEMNGDFPDFGVWGEPASIQLTNTLQPGAGTRTQSFQTTHSGGVRHFSITDAMGRITTYRYGPGATNGFGIKLPGSTAEDVVVSFDGSGRVSSVTKAGGTTTYAYVDDGAGHRTTTATDPMSHVTTYVFDIASQRMRSATSHLGKVTSWEYDSYGRLTKTTAHEGNYTQYTYDARGNRTEVRSVQKTGPGPGDIVTTAAFELVCSNVATCNQPTWTRDAKGNQTDYTYDPSTGNLLTVSAPAAAPGGVRPVVTYGYTTVNGVQILNNVSVCQTAASCTGTADEVKATFSYDANGLPTSVSEGAGNGSLTATTAATYNWVGDVVSIDGPLAGTADATVYRYNAARQPIGVVSPDPDGSGPLTHRAQRIARDDKGRPTLVEAGNVNSQSDADWAGFVTTQQVTSTYSAAGFKVQDTVTSSGVTYQLTQYSYDADGKLDCTAQRMNSATWGSLPDVCSQSVSSAPFDRIARNSYNADDQLTRVQTAYATADQSDEVTNAYTDNGKLASVTDGEGNKTSYEYDGFDRLKITRYPVTTVGAGANSMGDYEELGYDAASNVTSRRLRDGQTITYGYDNLNRPTSKVTPGSVAQDWDVAYSYDLLGRLTNATGDGWAVNAFTYDALGRLITEQNYNATTYHAWDLAGRQTRLTWNDGNYVDYDYNVTGDVAAIRENGATSGPGVLASYAYDNLGRRTSITRGNGTVTSYGYDGVSRLASLTQDLAGGAWDFTHSFTYTPAGQIASLARNNDAYAWTRHYNVDRTYGINGLNQMTTAGATSLGYDGRGNLNSSGGSTYTYTTENRMRSGPGAAMIYEPAAGQLLQLYNTGTGQDTRFAWSGGQMIAEINPANWSIMRRYVPGPGADEPVVWYEGAGLSDKRWLHADERGSVVAVSDTAGTAIGINRYDEYGIPASTNIGRFQYTGQAWLPELGMYYYKARIYSPSLGRFMQTDPIGYGDGMNLYNYVGGDPVNFIDPSGLKQDIPRLPPIRLPPDVTISGHACSWANGCRVYAPGITYTPPVLRNQLSPLEDGSIDEGEVSITAGKGDGEKSDGPIYLTNIKCFGIGLILRAGGDALVDLGGAAVGIGGTGAAIGTAMEIGGAVTGNIPMVGAGVVIKVPSAIVAGGGAIVQAGGAFLSFLGGSSLRTLAKNGSGAIIDRTPLPSPVRTGFKQGAKYYSDHVPDYRTCNRGY